MKRLPLPNELKLEYYEKRVQTATFDRLDLVISFHAGKDGIGAIVGCFLDAIKSHDIIVKMIEDKVENISALKRIYMKKSRLFRNLDSAWNIMLDNSVDFYDYIDLLPRMKNVENRLRLITDSKIHAEVLTEYRRFQSLHNVCSRQLIIHDAYSVARLDRDNATKALSAAESELTQLKDSERVAAAKISDDHIYADDAGQSLSAIFPNVQVGQLLQSINGVEVSQLPFEEVLKKISRSKSPHIAEFLRYDFRYNAISREWLSLEELRAAGVCLEDPMLQRANFVALAASGDSGAVSALLLEGADPNACDYSGSTAMHLAAAGRHSDVVEMLVKAGAAVNGRDKNMMTPLLFAVSCGNMEMVRLLLDLGADKDCCDKSHRNVLQYAVLSGNQAVVKLFLRAERRNDTEKVWGFSLLHLAASKGDLLMVDFLVRFGCSIYRMDRKGVTAEGVAVESGHHAIAELLAKERLEAPAQVMHVDETSGDAIWIGDEAALEINWNLELEFSHVLFFCTEENDLLPAQCAWLSSCEHLQFTQIVIPTGRMKEMEDFSEDDWTALNATLPTFLPGLLNVLKRRDGAPSKVLICDSTCQTIAPAVFAIVMLLKHQARIKDSLRNCRDLRPSVGVSLAVQKGLEKLQKAVDDKILRRLDAHLRHSNVFSSAF